MKRKKTALLTALSITSITLAACGKTDPEITANSNTIPDTETVLQEITEPETEEPETEEPETENGITMVIKDGKAVYPDFPEDYVKFTSIDPTDKYVITDSRVYNNPNMTKGKLTAGGMEYYGNQLTVDATCNMDGVDYFRIKPNNQNLVLIIPASVLADELPSEKPEEEAPSDDTTTSTNDNTGDTGNDDVPDDITYEYVDIPGYEIGSDFVEGQVDENAWDNVDPGLLDAAAGMTLE